MAEWKRLIIVLSANENFPTEKKNIYTGVFGIAYDTQHHSIECEELPASRFVHKNP